MTDQGREEERNHTRAELQRLSRIARELHSRLIEVKAPDLTPDEEADIDMAREIAGGLEQLTST